MRRLISFLIAVGFFYAASAQDTSIFIENRIVTLPAVLVSNDLNYKKLLAQIKYDSSFYKAFRNLRVLGFSAYNDIQMLDKKGNIKASLYSKTRQHHSNGCRTMDVLDEEVTGDFYDANHQFNYLTAEMYAGLFFTKGKICGENNIVKGFEMNTAGKGGMEKHKEQLKMLFFNPGRKIPGIPFIGDKLDLYDADAQKVYDYRLDLEEHDGTLYYVFNIRPKDDLGFFKKNKVVVDEMTTWFDRDSFDVMYRSYSLSYNAGVYNFNVRMEVTMTKFGDLVVPKILRYAGDWNVVFKKKERGRFTATLFDYKK